MKANTPDETVDRRARRRLRQLRTARGFTLQQVAERANIDISTLSRLESGKRRLALDHIPALAGALGVSTDELLGTEPHHDPRVHGAPIVRDRMTMWPLTRRGAGALQVYKIRIHADRDRPPAVLPTHEGQDWLYVMEGRMRLMLGDSDLTIVAGEAVEFSTLTPHWFGAVDGPVEVVGIFGAHGERVHVHP